MLKHERKMSIAARLWLASNNIYPPIANQIVFEGRGVLDEERWRRAVEKVAESNPGCRLVVKGHVGFSHWVASDHAPLVRAVDAGGWDGTVSEGAPFTQNLFSPGAGPMAEVVLIKGEPLRVVFRSHHSLMDGVGTFSWAEDIFRVLRGEEVLNAVTDITENDLMNFAGAKLAPPVAHQFLAPSGRAVGNAPGVIWRRRVIRGRFPGLLIQVMLLAAREAWRHGSGTVKLVIPVDLRARRKGLRSYGNLTSALYIEIKPETTAKDLEAEIALKIKEQNDGQLTWEDRVMPHLPLWVLETALRAEARRSHRQGGYRFSGIVSNVGRLPVEAFYGGGFTTEAIWGVPICIESCPFSWTMGAVGDANGITLAMPRVLGDDGRLEKVMDNIVAGLKSA
ncbi:MAG: hypothetical protein JW807_16440 [Spirochaetes bacterium]|nr:hypothetical protein [Spirochaetota bacterium]